MTSAWARNGALRRRLRLFILDRDRHVCHWCGGYADTVDHVTPRIEGGTDHPANLVAACGACNSRRSLEWVRAHRGVDPTGRRRGRASTVGGENRGGRFSGDPVFWGRGSQVTSRALHALNRPARTSVRRKRPDAGVLAQERPASGP